MRTLSFLLIAFGAISTLISLPLLGFAALGFLGVLADVSVAENREYGVQLVSMGLPPLIIGAISCWLGVLALNRSRRRSDAESAAASDRQGL